MQTRARGILITLTFLVGFGAAFWYSQALNALRSEAAQVHSNLSGVAHVVALLKGSIEQKAAAMQVLESLNAQRGPLENKLAEARATFAKYRSEAAAQELAFDQAVTTLRRAAKGSSLGSMVLNNGKVLAGVTVKAVLGDCIAVAHASGTAHLFKADLPFEISERFKLDDPVIGLANAPAGAEITALSELETQSLIAALRAQISIAEASHEKLQQRVNDYREATANSAGTKPTPAQNLTSPPLLMANHIQTLANQMQIQLMQDRSKISALRVQLYALQGAPN